MKLELSNKIINKGYPTSNKCYPQAHRKANKAEISKYGKSKFNKLNIIIKQLIPKDELAGSHTKQGIIIVSKKIPIKYRNQIKLHEQIEHENMKIC